jgi:hypothetical protein
MIDLNLLSRRLEPPLPCWATTWTSWLSLQLVLGSGKSWVCPKMGSQKHGNFDGKSTDQPWDCGYGIFRSMYCLLAMFQVPMVLQKPSLRDEALQCPCKRIEGKTSCCFCQLNRICGNAKRVSTLSTLLPFYLSLSLHFYFVLSIVFG